MQTHNTGSSTSLTDAIAELMARAAELSDDRFRETASEQNAFLVSAGGKRSAVIPGASWMSDTTRCCFAA